MKASVEFLGFATVAALAHLAVFAATLPDGTESGGADGAQSVTQDGATISSADDTLAALVATWDSPPKVFDPAASPDAPALDQAPATTTPDIPDLAQLPQAMALPARPMDALPQITEPPALFSQPATRDTPRPRARPEPKPPPRAARASASAPPSSRAQGQGRSPEQGQGTAQTRSGNTASASALTQWGGAIRAAVLRQQGRANGRGVVHLRLSVTAAGQLAHVSVTQSSGNARLDAAAQQAVRRARLPRAPAGISGTHSFNLPIRFQ